MENICYIVGAGDASGAHIKKRAGDIVIAADAGLKTLRALNVEPDLAVGDFDSLGAEPRGMETVRHPPEKDDTDMKLAIDEGLRRGFETFALLGGTGGRLDHTLANIQTLAFLARRGKTGFLIGGGAVITAVTDGAVRIPAGRSGFLSVFGMESESRGVYLRGLKYPLTDAVLTYDAPIGVSNELTGSAAEIAVERGTLAVLWYEDMFDPAGSGITITHRRQA